MAFDTWNLSMSSAPSFNMSRGGQWFIHQPMLGHKLGIQKANSILTIYLEVASCPSG